MKWTKTEVFFFLVAALEILVIACIAGAVLMMTGCGNVGSENIAPLESPATQVETEQEEFARLSGWPDAAGWKPIGFESCFSHLPVLVYIQETDQPPEMWEKAFRFWEFVAGEKVFELSTDLTKITDQDVVVSYDASAARPFGKCGSIIMNQETPNWELPGHELGHALGFGHSEQPEDRCLMVNPEDKSAPQGCDLSILRDYVESLGDCEQDVKLMTFDDGSAGEFPRHVQPKNCQQN